MKVHHEDERVTLWHGDALDVLRQLPDASVDAVCTDPPYGLEFMGKDWDAPWQGKAKTEFNRIEKGDLGGFTALPNHDRVNNVKCANCNRWRFSSNPCKCDKPKFPNARAEAMRAFQDWCLEWATECLRVLKPGGHLLAFGGTRTWHRLACAVEDAGFEVRDSIAWLYGSGFPKSLDVSKAIDRQRKDDPAWRVVGQWLKAHREAAGFSTRAAFAPLILDGHRNLESAAANLSNWENGLSCPTWERWLSLKALLSLPDDMDAEVWRLNGRKGTPGEAWGLRPVTGAHAAGLATGPSGVGGAGAGKDRRDIPATPDAERWQGWGTALKPAFEPVVVARKPLAGTVAANVLAHGTGALNIDACRVATSDDTGRTRNTALGVMNDDGWQPKRQESDGHTAGRWPTNVVLDDSQAAELDRQSGVSTSKRADRGAQGGIFRLHGFSTPEELRAVAEAGGKCPDGRDAAETYRRYLASVEGENTRGHDDSGGASRFFPTFRYEAKAPTSERPRVNGVAHPTVKPLDLMRWLVRLVTPPGGTVLEPFAGSGTTVEACLVEGFRCIAIEREADYLPLIMQRVNRRRDAVAYIKAAGDDLGLFDLEGEGS